MKPECEAAVRAAAGNVDLTKADLDGIQSRVLQAMKSIRRKDPDAWSQMDATARYKAGAELARKWWVEQVARKNALAIQRLAVKTREDARVESVQPGRNGRMAAMLASEFYKADERGQSTGIDMETRAVTTLYWRKLEGEHSLMMQDPTKQAALYEALYGKDVGDAAVMKTAAAVRKQFDALAQAQLDAGILDARIDNYLPQKRDWTRMGDMETWIKKQMDRQDLGEYVNEDGSPMSADQIRKSMEAMFATLATNGANKLDGAQGFGGRVGARGPRHIRYKDGASHMAEMQDYGHGSNLMEIVKAHIQASARDLAAARRHGYMADRDVIARARAARAADLLAVQTAGDKTHIDRMYHQFERMWDVQRRGSAPGNARWANVGRLLRAIPQATMLGASNALPDAGMARVFLHGVGLETNRLVGDFLKGASPTKENRFRIGQMGIFSEGMHDSHQRFGEDQFGVGATVAKFLSDGVYKAMGLRVWDRMMANGISSAIMRSLGRWISKWPDDMAALDAKSLEYLQRKGVTQAHWNVWKMAELDKGPDADAPMLTPDAIEAIPDEAFKGKTPQQIRDAKMEAQVKLLAIMHTDMQTAGRGFAGLSLRDQDNLGYTRNPAGTLTGELLRTLVMIRQVPLGIARTHMVDVPARFDKRSAAWLYRARFLALTTLLGGLGVQLKQVANGQDPADMTSYKFWGRALLASGGLGLWGDALWSPNSDHTESGVVKVLGPGATSMNDLFNIFSAARSNPEKFGDPNWQGQVVRFIRNNATPFMRLWYVRAAFDHLVYQQMMDMVNPGYKRRVRRAMQKNQESAWWKVGDTTPQRGPDVGQAIGQNAQ
jgi:hypothetical protein